MIDLKDIQEKIKNDFGNNAPEAFKILRNAILKTQDLNQPRLIRCILFLADKNLEKLRSTIQSAMADPRDVMLWAEYTDRGTENTPKRARDFNNTFDQADANIPE